MQLLITGICGFVGSTLAKALVSEPWVTSVAGIDNFSRSGSELNRLLLKDLGIQVIAGDIRCQSDVDGLPACDFVIDAAANPSVLAGVDGKTSSRQLVEHNLSGTINILEYCKRYQAGFVLLSTSRVYSIAGLASLQMMVEDDAFKLNPNQSLPLGITPFGVSETYSTSPPVSLYGSTKVTSEHLALEYGATFDFPVWINRCGVMAGAGQFGHPAQGIFAYWIHSFREEKPLKYIGFGGSGYQVRDCLHPRDLVALLARQASTNQATASAPQIINVAGGVENSMSLAKLTDWCANRYPQSKTNSILASQSKNTEQRQFDIPWMVLDSRSCMENWEWSVQSKIHEVLEEIADCADRFPNWLAVSR